MERYIAIDNVCAWPNLTKMPDGAIIATIFNQPCHGLWEGDVECWASENGGRTWSEPAILLESHHRTDMKWPHSDGGYPASVPLDDGRIATAWYSSAAPGVHERYHMGMAIWTVEAGAET